MNGSCLAISIINLLLSIVWQCHGTSLIFELHDGRIVTFLILSGVVIISDCSIVTRLINI